MESYQYISISVLKYSYILIKHSILTNWYWHTFVYCVQTHASPWYLVPWPPLLILTHSAIRRRKCLLVRKFQTSRHGNRENSDFLLADPLWRFSLGSLPIQQVPVEYWTKYTSVHVCEHHDHNKRILDKNTKPMVYFISWKLLKWFKSLILLICELLYKTFQISINIQNQHLWSNDITKFEFHSWLLFT